MARYVFGKSYDDSKLMENLVKFYKESANNVILTYKNKDGSVETVTVPNINKLIENIDKAEEILYVTDADIKSVNPTKLDTILVNRNSSNSDDVTIYLCLDNKLDDNKWLIVGSNNLKTGNKGLPEPVADGPDSVLESVDTKYNIKNYNESYTYTFETVTGSMSLVDTNTGKLIYNSGSVDEDVSAEIYITATLGNDSGTTKLEIRVINSSNVVDQELINYDYLNNGDNNTSNNDFTFGKDWF